MIKSKLWIVLTVSLLLSNTVWAKFCSECGKPLPSDTAKFCSECGASINGNSGSLATNKSDSIQDKVEELFAPVDEFAVFLSSSNFLTCIAKYPEYKIKFNKNKKDIDYLQATCDDITKKVIKNYYLYWSILCDSMENYTQRPNYRRLADEHRCKFLLSYINDVKNIWKTGGSLAEITKAEKRLIVATKEFTVSKSKYLTVKDEYTVLMKNAKFMLMDVNDNEVRIVLLGGQNGGTGAGLHGVGSAINPNNSIDHLWMPVVLKSELLKRTDCTEDDLNTFKIIIQK